jgi:hypothetical protein
MKIRVLKDWRRMKTGDVCERPDGFANVLIRRGIAEEVKPETGSKRRGKARSGHSAD